MRRNLTCRAAAQLLACHTVQAAVASATSNVLRKLGQSHERLHGTARQHVGGASRDCVIALCQWRDEVAREDDEGEMYLKETYSGQQAKVPRLLRACLAPDAYQHADIATQVSDAWCGEGFQLAPKSWEGPARLPLHA